MQLNKLIYVVIILICVLMMSCKTQKLFFDYSEFNDVCKDNLLNFVLPNLKKFDENRLDTLGRNHWAKYIVAKRTCYQGIKLSTLIGIFGKPYKSSNNNKLNHFYLIDEDQGTRFYLQFTYSSDSLLIDINEPFSICEDC